MNLKQPSSFDAPEPPWHLKPRPKVDVGAEFEDHDKDTQAPRGTTNVHPEETAVMLVPSNGEDEPLPMGDEEDAKPIEAEEAPDEDLAASA